MNDHIVHLENGRLASDTPHNHVQTVIANAVAHGGAGGIAFHFHGGLVNEAKAREIAERLTPDYLAAGAFPVFLVWESGLLETLRNNLDSVSGEKIMRVILKRVRKIVKRKVRQSEGQRSANVLPDVDTSQEDTDLDARFDRGEAADMEIDAISEHAGLLSVDERATLEAELQQDLELLEVAQSLSDSFRDPADIEADLATRSVGPVVVSAETLMDVRSAERIIDRPDPSARGLISAIKLGKAIVKIAARVIKRMILKRAHGPHATIVEEILREFYLANVGGKIWAAMKQDTADSFGDDPTVFGGTAILTELKKHADAGNLPKVTLVGHSTGAVYISHWIAAADQILPSNVTFDIVFLAPASTAELTTSTIEQSPHRIGGFRMFAMTDENERSDRLVPVLYPHSLLYFVSGVVEPAADTPIVGMQRYYDEDHYEAGEFPNAETVRHFVGSHEAGAIWSVAVGAPGRNTSSLKHGDFDNDGPTIASVQHILGQGF